MIKKETGKIFIFPTDTIYALATQLYDEDGLKRIYDIKGRSFDKKCAVLCRNVDDVRKITELTTRDEDLIAKYFPGAVTLIFNSSDDYFKRTKEKTVGVRIPDKELTQALLELYGPMKATSVNQSGQPPLKKFEEIFFTYQHVVDLFYDTDYDSTEVASTIVDATGKQLMLLRQGTVIVSEAGALNVPKH